MLKAELEVEGLDEIKRKLAGFDRQLNREMTQAMHRATGLVRGEIAEYPPATAANTPGAGYSWYERGFGTRTITGLAYPTSETLGRSWTESVTSSVLRWEGRIGTNVSYAPFVHGEQQAAFHGARGWKKADDVLRGLRASIKRIFEQALRRLVFWWK